MITLRSFDTCYGKYLPKLGSVRNDAHPLIRCKFYDSAGDTEWYVLEGEKSGENYLFYGYVVGKNPSVGLFTFKDLEKLNTVAISLFFKPSPLSHVPAFRWFYSHR